MNSNSIKWGLVFLVITCAFIYQPSHDFLIFLTKNHPYLMGFLKFAVLAFLGELLGIRISKGVWEKPVGVPMRIVAWGLMGTAVAFVLPFSYMASEVFGDQGLLSFAGEPMQQLFIKALTASVIFNMLPGPMTIIYHKMAESWIDLSEGNIYDLIKVGFSNVIRNVDWENLIRNVLLKVNLILFIPINTIVFLLPVDLRVLMAAYASIVLGAVLGYRKARSGHTGGRSCGIACN